MTMCSHASNKKIQSCAFYQIYGDIDSNQCIPVLIYFCFVFAYLALNPASGNSGISYHFFQVLYTWDISITNVHIFIFHLSIDKRLSNLLDLLICCSELNQTIYELNLYHEQV